MASPLFHFGGTWNDSPIGSALIAAETALRIIADECGDCGLCGSLSAAQDAYAEQVTSR